VLRVAVGSGLAAAGYLLLYSAVTAGGTYALRPWDALSPSAPWPVNPSGGTSSNGGSGAAGSSSSSSGSGGVVGIAKRVAGFFGSSVGTVMREIP
jgi:hypothetical protein